MGFITPASQNIENKEDMKKEKRQKELSGNDVEIGTRFFNIEKHSLMRLLLNPKAKGHLYLFGYGKKTLSGKKGDRLAVNVSLIYKKWHVLYEGEDIRKDIFEEYYEPLLKELEEAREESMNDPLELYDLIRIPTPEEVAKIWLK